MESRSRHSTLQLAGAGAKSAEGTATDHKNAEAMGCSGVRVECTVRLVRVVTVSYSHF